MLEVLIRPMLPLAPAQVHGFVVKATRVAVLVKEMLSTLRRCLEAPFAPFHQATEHLSTGKALYQIAISRSHKHLHISKYIDMTFHNTHI